MPLWVKPNAGLPRMTGDSAVYDVTPEQLGEAARGYVEAGARVVGGCCGSTPEHVRAITEAIKRRVSCARRRRASAASPKSTKRTSSISAQLLQGRPRRRDRDPAASSTG